MRVEVCPTREDWLMSRQSGIGGSEAPSVLGINPFATPIDLWAEKTGQLPAVEATSRAAIMGHRLEALVAQEYAELHPDVDVLPAEPYTIRWLEDGEDMKFPFATIDRRLIRKSKPGALEIKTTSGYLADLWEDEPPFNVQTQLQHQLGVTGWEWGVIAVLFDGREYREWEYQRDDAFINDLFRAEYMFWECVKNVVQPNVKPSPEIARAILRLHPNDNGKTIQLPPSFFAVDERLQIVQAEMKKLEQEEKELKAKLQCEIGANTFGEIPGLARYSLKTTARGAYSVEATTYRALRRSDLTEKPKKRSSRAKKASRWG